MKLCNSTFTKVCKYNIIAKYTCAKLQYIAINIVRIDNGNQTNWPFSCIKAIRKFG